MIAFVLAQVFLGLEGKDVVLSVDDGASVVVGRRAQGGPHRNVVMSEKELGLRGPTGAALFQPLVQM